MPIASLKRGLGLGLYAEGLHRLISACVLGSLLAACSTVEIPETVASDAPEKPIAQQPVKTAATIIAEPISSTVTYEEPTDLWERLRLGFDLTADYAHPSVSRQLKRYRQQQDYFDLVTERAQPFLYEVIEQIEQRGLPLELALVPFVESAFNPDAYSHQDAAGLWQFVSATGRSYGLEQTWWLDERRDPLESTRAALDYLEVLYAEFDEDWILALAAYNAGGGNIRRALKNQKNQASDSRRSRFWDLNLNEETRDHIPRILALALVIKSPAEYGVELVSIPNERYLYPVTLTNQIDLSLAARLAEFDLGSLKQLNPHYRQWATPPDDTRTLYLPDRESQRLTSALLTLDRSTLVTFDRYRIKTGDTLSAIARRLGTKVDVLQRANGLKGSRIIAGDSLLIPRGDISESQFETIAQDSKETQRPPASYTVKRGDNLWSIARRYNIRSEDILQMNNLLDAALLQPGQKLVLRNPASRQSNSTNSD